MTEIDATGRYVLPVSSTPTCTRTRRSSTRSMQLAALRQGVTTLLLGQDGLSFAPASPGTIDVS